MGSVSGSSGGSGNTRYVVAGATSSIFAGNGGYRAMNAACKSDFGETARMANSFDLSRNPPSAALSGMVWIQGIAHASNVNTDDTSGLQLSNESNLTCSSWTSTLGNGLALHGNSLALNKYASCGNSLKALCAVADGNEPDYKFVGFSSSTMAGNAGYFGMADACRSDYGSNARVASTEEIAVSSIDTTQSGVAWVQGIPHASNPAIDAITGVRVGSGSNLSCDGWSDSSSNEGLIVDGNTYTIESQACYLQVAAACSAPQ